MDARFSPAALGKALRYLSGISSEAPGSPYSVVCVEALKGVLAKGALRVHASDGDAYAVAELGADVKSEGCVHAHWTVLKRVADAVAIGASKDEARFCTAKKGTSAEVTVKGTSCSNVPLLHDSEGFPPYPESLAAVGGGAVDVATLSRALDAVQRAASRSHDRPALACVCFESEGLVATDGNRFARCAVDLSHVLDGQTRVSVPLSAAQVLGRMLGAPAAGETCRLLVGDAGLRVWRRGEGLSLKVARVNAPFPQYSGFLAAEKPLGVEVPLAALRSLVERATLLRKDAVFTFDSGSASVFAEGDAGAYSECVDFGQPGGDSVTIRLDLHYLADALEPLRHGAVSLELAGSDDAFRIRGLGADAGYVALVMPLKSAGG